METRFWQPYKDKGVVVIAIDANGDSMQGLQDYLKHIPRTYPVGLEDTLTPTYRTMTAAYKGFNPFPVDVVVDRNGNIAYVAREYDPEGIKAAVDKLLAQP
jgi:hypothetical protein